MCNRFGFPSEYDLMILDAPEHKDDAGNNSKGEGVGEVSEQYKISLMRENSHCMDQKILV